MTSPEQEVLIEACESEDSAAIVAALLGMLKSPNHQFKGISAVLAKQLFAEGKEGGAKLVLNVVSTLLDPQNAQHHSSTACHVLLDAVPMGSMGDVPAEVMELRSEAATVFESACHANGKDSAAARIMSKLASTFQLSMGELTDVPAVVEYIKRLLEERATLTPAVSLIMQFQGLEDSFDRGALIEFMVAEGQDGLTEKWVTGLEEQDKIIFVEQCILNDRLKTASKAVRTFGLHSQFPDVEQIYKQRTIAKLVAKRLWAVASTIVGNDPDTQMLLLREMAHAGEMALAEEYRQQYGLPEGVLIIDEAAIAEEERRRAESYLQMEVPLENVHFVDTRDKLLQAAIHLQQAPALGMDVEWRPSHLTTGSADDESGTATDGGSTTAAASSAQDSRSMTESESEASRSVDIASVAGTGSAAGPQPSTSCPASLLQIGTADRVYLLDLIALRGQPEAVDECLMSVFQSKNTLKIGFDIKGDLSKLASSYPAVQAFRCLEAVLDLKDLWLEYAQQMQRMQGGAHLRTKQGVGLSRLSHSLLGKPLDKAMQVSDWELRPLTPRQIEYSAQDAHVLLRLYQQFQNRLSDSESIVQQKIFSFQASGVSSKASKGRRGHKRCNDERSDGQNGDGGGDGDGGGAGGNGAGGGNGLAPRDASHGSGVNSGAEGSTGIQERNTPGCSGSGGAGGGNLAASMKALKLQPGCTLYAPAAPYRQSSATQARAGAACGSRMRASEPLAACAFAEEAGPRVPCMIPLESGPPSSSYIPKRVVDRLRDCHLLNTVYVLPNTARQGKSIARAMGAAMAIGVEIHHIAKTIALVASQPLATGMVASSNSSLSNSRCIGSFDSMSGAVSFECGQPCKEQHQESQAHQQPPPQAATRQLPRQELQRCKELQPWLAVVRGDRHLQLSKACTHQPCPLPDVLYHSPLGGYPKLPISLLHPLHTLSRHLTSSALPAVSSMITWSHRVPAGKCDHLRDVPSPPPPLRLHASLRRRGDMGVAIRHAAAS